MASETDRLRQAWVTTVLDDDDLLKALVLRRSFQRVNTTRPFVVITTPILQLKQRSLLSKEFDQIFILDHPTGDGNGLTLKDYSKLFAFTLHIFKKCVYLDAGSLILNNCDDIFDRYNSFNAVVHESIRNGSNNETVDSSVFFFVPNVDIYEALVTTMKMKRISCKATFDDYLKAWMANQSKDFEFMDPKYNRSIGHEMMALEEKDIGIVHLKHDFKLPRDANTGHNSTLDAKACLGALELAALQKWLSIYETEVEPLMSSLDETQDLITTTLPERSSELMTLHQSHESIAIVGMSCRYPEAKNLDEFWSLLFEGREAVQRVPNDRWNEGHCDNSKPDIRNTQASFLNVPVDEFDGKFFGISPKELEFLDPQQRLLHELVWEGLENAAINPLSLRGTHAGVFFGAWMYDYKDQLMKAGTEEFYRTYMGNSFGAAAARISFFLGLTGPSVATESGCSSSMVSIDMACKSIRRGESSMAIACGVNLLLTPFVYDDISFVISPDGRCKTFDESADGFGRAEGCGVLILKRHSDAVRDGDRIWGLIRGCSTAQEGLSKSMGTPTRHSEALAMKLALKDAGVHPSQVSYVETHGTGTPVGDPMEVSAIADVYSLNRTEPLLIGSVKTNIGHTESCSAMPGIMKVVLSMKHGVIPPHRNLTTLNPRIDLSAIPAVIPDKPVLWERSPEKKRFAGVSSFGITGTDGHLILEEPPEKSCNKIDLGLCRPLHMLTFSAKTEEALDGLLDNYSEVFNKLIENEKPNFADICYTANVGRAPFNHRAVLLASTTEEAKICLESRKYMKEEVKEGPGKICFLFTGQGSQYNGMARELYEGSPIFRLNFDKCAQILESSYQLNIRNALWSTEEINGKDHLLTRTIYSQTSIFCVEYSLFKLWESWGIKPDYVLGHSTGEFVAAVAANVLELADALTLVTERSRLIDNLPCNGKMLVIKSEECIVDSHWKIFVSSPANQDKWLDYAAINSKEQTVLAGEDSTIDDFSVYCTNNGLKTHVLEATHSFHSRQMDPILPEYEKIASKIKNKKTNSSIKEVKYISAVDGKLIPNPSCYINSNYWSRHTRGRVSFLNASKAALFDEGCTTFLEIGPHPVLSALTTINSDDENGITTTSPLCLPSIRRSQNDWNTLLSSLAKLYLAGYQINWKGFDQYIPRQKVDLPHYPFQRKKYWFERADGSMLKGKVLHPLLGCLIPNASSNQLYQSGVTLKNLDHQYLKDHCIGNKVVLPGAAYLEMCFAAGHCTTQCFTEAFYSPAGPLAINNFKILRPLMLESGKVCQMQTIIDCSGSGSSNNEEATGMTVKIFAQLKHENEMPKWIHHASAQFSPVASNADIQNVKHISVEEIKQKLKYFPTEDFYGKLNKIGLEFGPAFKSLQHVWRSKGRILAQTKYVEMKGYIIHPTVFDAMIQVAMIALSGDNPVDKLHVPLSIKKCVWLEQPKKSDGSFYIHCNSEQPDIVVLYDEDGTPIAMMEGVELIQTSLQQIETMLDNHKTQIPLCWEETWKRKSLGPWEKRVNAKLLSFNNTLLGSNVEFSQFDEISKDEQQTENQLDKLVYLYILDAFYKLGWNKDLKVGKVIQLDQFMNSLSISCQHSRLVSCFLEFLAEERILTKTDDPNAWVVINMPPAEPNVEENIRLIHTQLKMDEEKEFQLVMNCGINLAKILKGEDTGLRILFPEDSSSSPSAATFYKTYYARKKVFEKFSQVLEAYLKPMAESQANHQKDVVLRLLEVGAGGGSFTEHVVSLLEKLNISFEYTYTDISQAFFSKAENKFEKHQKNMKFKTLNIEQDPATQGFCPGYYDIVLGGDVIHATKELQESLHNIRKLLRPHGIVWIEESTIPCREVTLIFGLLEGYWRYTDLDIRPSHAVVSGTTLEKLMTSVCGFSETFSVTCYKGYHGLIFGAASQNEIFAFDHKHLKERLAWLLFLNTNTWTATDLERMQNLLLSAGKTPILVQQSEKFMCRFETIRDDAVACTVRPSRKSDLNNLITQLTSRSDIILEGVIYGWGITSKENCDQGSISQPYLHLLQILAELNVRKIPKILMISEGVISTGGDYNFASNPSAGTLWGISKSFHNEYPNIPCRSIDLCVDDEMDTKISQIYAELWIEDKETQVAYRDNKRLCNRLVSTTLSNSDLQLPNNGAGERFQLILPQTKSISDLKFDSLPKYTLAPKEIEIGVKATALNFRDILAVLKPNAYFENVNKLGLDICGVVTAIGTKVTKFKVGDQIFGCNLEEGKALPSHARCLEDAVIRMPPNLTSAECATLPTILATSLFALVMVSKLQPGETVLIHTASGGVGLSAIQVAQHIGANIIATAGSAKKRAYLRNLGISHVFHSRNTKYEQEIMKVTGGKGVDVVLNSLTSPGFKEASLNSCAQNARFVEMSKLNIWTEDEVKELRSDVDYTIIDLTTCSKEEWHVINEKMEEFLREGYAKPIPYIRFDAVDIREALTYLQKAKHIGKVVCLMPEFKLENGRRLVQTPLFNDRSTYLVTGGLGGIGIEVAKWMCIQGARNLILVGRKAPNETATEVVKQLTAGGNKIIPYSADVGDLGQCEKLINFIKDPVNNLPPLRGIMHCAGILSDSILSNQTYDKFQATYNSKVYGTLNLHQLTKDERLEYFVMFSSIASLFGPPGQSNHAASNAFLDAFTHFRQSHGLRATSINWGVWGQVGVAVGKEFPGVQPFSTQRGLNALGKILREQERTQVSVAEVQMTVFQKFFGGIHTYLEDVLYKDSDKNGRKETASSVSSEIFWKQLDSAETPEEKLGVIRDNVKSVIRQILKLEKNEPIDDSSTFQEIGLDSLMMVEMKNLLQGILGKRISLSANDLKDCSSISLITHKLHSLINCPNDSNNIAPEKMSSEQFKKLIRDDSTLPPHIRNLDTNAPAKNIKECETFLVTGVTGNLAPYFLRDLFKHAPVSKIYCLVRAKTNESAQQRLRSVLKERGVLDSIDFSKISCVAGDLSKQKFGVDDEAYLKLADEVDAVIHCAVKASHIEIYRKSDDLSDIRNVNFNGTLSILEFATCRKTKHILHASTLLAIMTTDSDGALSEDWPNVDDFDNLTQMMGYPISKFICDLLMKEAVQRGIPCKVFRLPAIAGDSVTGRFNYQNNHLLMRLLSYMRLGAMPCVPLPVNILPADTCAEIALSIFFNSDAPADIYNVCQEKPQHEQAFVEVAKEMGYEIDVVEFPEFVKKLEQEGEGSLLYSLRDIYLNEELYTSLFFAPQAIQQWFVNPDDFFKCKKVDRFYTGELGKQIPSSMEIIRRDLIFAKNQGIFQKLGV